MSSAPGQWEDKHHRFDGIPVAARGIVQCARCKLFLTVNEFKEGECHAQASSFDVNRMVFPNIPGRQVAGNRPIRIGARLRRIAWSLFRMA